MLQSSPIYNGGSGATGSSSSYQGGGAGGLSAISRLLRNYQRSRFSRWVKALTPSLVQKRIGGNIGAAAVGYRAADMGFNRSVL